VPLRPQDGFRGGKFRLANGDVTDGVGVARAVE
jgi:hypothetical protein